MFDRTFITPTEVRHVTENRAPTDESVRLLKELEEKALEKVLSFNVLDNELKMSWAVIDEPWTRSQFAECRLKLNDKIHKFRVEIPVDSQETIMELVMEAVKERLAAVITMDLFNTTLTKFRR